MEERNNILTELSSLLAEAIIDRMSNHDLNSSTLSVIDVNSYSKSVKKVPDRFSQVNDKIQFGQKDKLTDLKIELKDSLSKDVGESLTKLKKLITSKSKTYDEVIIQLSNFNYINSSFQNGLVGFETVRLELGKIRNSTLFIINNLDVEIMKNTIANNG